MLFLHYQEKTCCLFPHCNRQREGSRAVHLGLQVYKFTSFGLQAFGSSVQNSVILWNDCAIVESFSQDYGEDTSLLEFVCAQEYHFPVIPQAHCVNTHIHPSVCTSHTYLTMFGILD